MRIGLDPARKKRSDVSDRGNLIRSPCGDVQRTQLCAVSSALDGERTSL
jgi:hypothetical protein